MAGFNVDMGLDIGEDLDEGEVDVEDEDLPLYCCEMLNSPATLERSDE